MPSYIPFADGLAGLLQRQGEGSQISTSLSDARVPTADCSCRDASPQPIPPPVRGRGPVPPLESRRGVIAEPLDLRTPSNGPEFALGTGRSPTMELTGYAHSAAGGIVYDSPGWKAGAFPMQQGHVVVVNESSAQLIRSFAQSQMRGTEADTHTLPQKMLEISGPLLPRGEYHPFPTAACPSPYSVKVHRVVLHEYPGTAVTHHDDERIDSIIERANNARIEEFWIAYLYGRPSDAWMRQLLQVNQIGWCPSQCRKVVEVESGTLIRSEALVAQSDSRDMTDEELRSYYGRWYEPGMTGRLRSWVLTILLTFELRATVHCVPR